MILPLWKYKGRMPKFPTEDWVKKQIKDQLAKLNIWYFMPQGTNFGRAGMPDFICCANGHFIGIEAKKLEGIWSGVQAQIGSEINRANGVYIVVDETGLFALWELLAQWHYNNILPPGVHDFRRME